MPTLKTTGTTDEWNLYWPLVLVSCIGLSYQSVITYSFGLFIDPLTMEFGWSRSEVSAGLSLAALISIPLSPLLGVCIDRWGARPLALPGLILTAVSIMAFAFANGSISQWLALWVVYSIIGVGINSTVWTAAVSSVFNKGRGLALGVTLSGVALAQILAPPLAQWLIDSFDWRTAFVGLALGWGAPTFILCYLFLYDGLSHPQAKAKEPQDSNRVIKMAGLSIRQAIRSLALLRIALSTLIMMVLTIGVVVHQVPILTEAGVNRQAAAYLASLAGVAGIVGKLTTGYLMDRINADLVCSLTMAAAAVAFFMLLRQSGSLPVIVTAMVILGYSSGCKIQICAYQTSRYGGMLNFGKIFGVMASLISIGAGMGPFLAGLIYDLNNSYEPLLAAGIPLCLVAGALLFRLGPLPAWCAENQVVADPTPVLTARSD